MSKSKFICHVHADQHCVGSDGRNPHAVFNELPSLTQQHFAEECDINEILRRAASSGQLPINDKAPMYGDFTSIPKSLSESFALIKQANDLFMSLPWQARERFKNDPQQMIRFLQDPNNRDEAIKLGLVKAPEVNEALDTLKSIDASLKAQSDAESGKGASPAGGKA